MPRRRDQVWVHLGDRRLGLEGPIGRLSHEHGTYAFEYSRGWIADRGNFAIDPALVVAPGEVFSTSLPGIFDDAAPDRWGRLLLDRREQLRASRTGQHPRELSDWDYLLGIQDETRMGGIRLRADSGAYLASETYAIPPLADLRQMEHLVQTAESGAPIPASEVEAFLKCLIAPGASLGGARPKATFRHPDGRLWLAKFPSSADRRDVGGWEYILNQLAAAAGIVVPDSEVMKLNSPYYAFLAGRFDREEGGGRRRLFASAMTLTGKRDIEPAGYLDIVAAQEQYGNAQTIEQDLSQLFRRVVFNVGTAHRDDHLRNHGFVHDGRGWRPAPAYDLNPMPDMDLHVLALDDRSQVPSLETVRSTAPYYRLSPSDAEQCISEVKDAITAWTQIARKIGMPPQAMDEMKVAFKDLDA
jgi:serine/threonine-protein kinase HipA